MPVENIVSSAPHERGGIDATSQPVGAALTLERAAPIHRGGDVLDIGKRVETLESANGLRAGEGKIDRGDRIRICEGDGIVAGAPVESIVAAEADQQIVPAPPSSALSPAFPISVSPKPEPTTSSIPVSVSAPPPPVACAPVAARSTRTAAVASA